ncbi:MAG: SigB/SigF/SigG family RNA polymerase sigma factor [Bacilli bacterium]|nr:SigB/SigF/SigG family RNA polymerase sigma factor [Bacilli bacterium]MDD4809141.1 SigB/SigF/SigG family RNA polymerase sigma factor [Bacilli bacterium]
MSRHKVEICGVNTADIKVLTNEEQIALFKRLKAGDLLAKEKLIEGNLKLVLSILRKFNNRVDNLDDLFQVGCIGLIKAIDNFDLSYEVKFSTYSVPMILGEVKRYLRDNNSVRISRSIKDLAFKAIRKKEELTSLYNKEPTIEMIAKELGVSEFEVSNAIESTKDTISMFEPIYNDGSDTIYLSDQLEDKSDQNYSLDMKIALKDSLDKLKEKERYILTERYLVGKTQVELANEIGISQAQISRLEKSGIDNLKKMME